jgi:hypothetical protein
MLKALSSSGAKINGISLSNSQFPRIFDIVREDDDEKVVVRTRGKVKIYVSLGVQFINQ